MQHEAIAALPAAANADHALIRAMATRRFAYCLDADESAGSLVAVDPADGTLPLYLIQNGILFGYDSADTTTADDGVTCLVTSDGKRYKTDDVAFPYAVLSVSVSAQPVSPAPTLGDSYLVPAAATGTDWSGKDGKIAIFTSRGWVFVTAAIGFRVLAEDTDTSYYKNASGAWVAGFGSQALAAASVLPSNMLGGGGRVRWIVENSTTNSPPAVTNGVAYQIGSSPTGAWAGHAGKIAHGEGGVWVIYAPAEGWRSYNKATDSDYLFNGSTWITAGGNMKKILRVYTSNSTFSKDARCVMVEVTVVGGSGGNSVGGGTSSFGSHCSATGGADGGGGGGTSGAGSGGDRNTGGVKAHDGTNAISFTPTKYGPCAQAITTGGPGGLSIKTILAASLGGSEAVTVGAAGTGTPAGAAGIVFVEEWILI